MRNLIWIAVLGVFALATPIAHAQSDSGAKAGAYQAGAGMDPPGYKASALNPENCGTPDEPKACDGPVPAKPLKHYHPKPSAG